MHTPAVGDQVFVTEGGQTFGAVKYVGHGPSVTIYVEGSGEFTVTVEAIKAVHDGKVILAHDKLDTSLKNAITRAHLRETQ